VSSGSSSLTFVPVEDARVNSSTPTTNFGSDTGLRATLDSFTDRSYIKFTVSGLTGPVISAKLRLYVTKSSPSGGSVFTTTSVWNNAPAPAGSALSTLGNVGAGSTVEFDLGTSVTGNGTYSFALTSSRKQTVIYASRETATPPQLVLTQTGGGTPPVADFT